MLFRSLYAKILAPLIRGNNLLERPVKSLITPIQLKQQGRYSIALFLGRMLSDIQAMITPHLIRPFLCTLLLTKYLGISLRRILILSDKLCSILRYVNNVNRGIDDS